MNIAIVATLSSDPKITDSPSALPGSPPRRQWSALFVSARKYAQPSWITWPALRSVASGFDDVAAPERQPQAVPNDVTLSAVAWITCCWRRARSRSVSDGSSRFSRIRE